jgi:AhpC/TSA family.
MKSSFLVVLITINVLFNQFTIAQHTCDSPKLLIRGKVDNVKRLSWLFVQTGYFDNSSTKIAFDKDGNFKQIVPIEGIQNLYLYLNHDAITIYVQPNDTIDLYWDENNFDNSFTIKSPSFIRNRDLQLNLELYKKFRKDELSLSARLFTERKKEDSVKFKWINDQYNQQLKVVLGAGKSIYSSTPLFVNQIYFYYTELLLKNGLLNRYSLKNDIAIWAQDSLASLKMTYLQDSSSYRILNNVTFYECPNYRAFLFDYVNGGLLFNGNSISSLPINIMNTGDTINLIPGYANTKFYDKSNDVSALSPIIRAYYQGLSQIDVTPIRDWFITKSILSSFNKNSIEDVEIVLTDFLPKCKTKVYKDTLMASYPILLRFKQGNPAFDFKLKDESGKYVTLNNFKGKVVYIDFWGVGCAPCRSDIQNFVPKMHDKYRDKNVVFINICVDVNETVWKKTISNLKLDGVNLLAEGFTTNPVCIEYNINAVPHYILIDKNGRFKDYNAPRPSTLIGEEINIVDELLDDK